MWFQISEFVTPKPQLNGTVETDLAIIGAGLAGLATAYYVSKYAPGLSITVLEAGRIGAGATGGCTGIVSPGLKMALPQLRRKYGDEGARAAFDASQHGVDLLRQIVNAEHIDCDQRDEPHTLAATTVGQKHRMQTHLKALAELDRGVDCLSDTELTERAGPGFLAGLSYDNTMLVDPYQLLVGLTDTVITLGVTVFEQSRALTMEPLATGRGTRVSTATGSVVADKVLLAMDGYAHDLNPFPHSVVPIRAHVLATEPLTADQQEQLQWNGRGGVIDQRNFFNYYRMSADGRLVFGGGPVIVPTGDPVPDSRSADAVQQRLYRELTERFPALAGVRVSARWSALGASTQDRLPMVSTVPGYTGVYHAGAWCGHGLALAVDAAWRFARQLGGHPAETLPWSRRRALSMPRPALYFGTKAYLKLLDFADRREGRDIAVAVPQPSPNKPAATRKVALS
ncbi:oxidoreductase [Mycobacterium sp. E802]|nr:oxidoreductase [Mycobacterium sp. E802]